jgi:hypothetical protein
MQFSAFIIAAFAGLAIASPLIEERVTRLCSSALDTAQCCTISVDGVADLECESRTFFHSSPIYHWKYSFLYPAPSNFSTQLLHTQGPSELSRRNAPPQVKRLSAVPFLW